MGDYKIFHSRLKEAREKSGMKQKALADKVCVSVQTISAYERGKLPTIENVALIAETLNVSVDWLLGIEKPMEKPQNYADAFNLIETLEDALCVIATVHKEHIVLGENDPYDRPTTEYDEYSVTFTNCGKELGDAFIARREILRFETTPELRQEILSVWRKGTLDNLAKIPLPDLPF